MSLHSKRKRNKRWLCELGLCLCRSLLDAPFSRSYLACVFYFLNVLAVISDGLGARWFDGMKNKDCYRDGNDAH